MVFPITSIRTYYSKHPNRKSAYRNSRIDMVLGGDRVGDEQIHDLIRGETGITHPGEDLVGGVRRFRNGEIGSGKRDV